MSGIALNSPVQRGMDTACDIEFIGINYDQDRVRIRLRYQQTNQERDFVFEGPALTALRQNVANFAGLRTALLTYLQTLDAGLAGSVT